MKKITRKEAHRRFLAGKEVYRIYDDGSESLVENAAQIMDERFFDDEFAIEDEVHHHPDCPAVDGFGCRCEELAQPFTFDERLALLFLLCKQVQDETGYDVWFQYSGHVQWVTVYTKLKDKKEGYEINVNIPLDNDRWRDESFAEVETHLKQLLVNVETVKRYQALYDLFVSRRS